MFTASIWQVSRGILTMSLDGKHSAALTGSRSTAKRFIARCFAKWVYSKPDLGSVNLVGRFEPKIDPTDVRDRHFSLKHVMADAVLHPLSAEIGERIDHDAGDPHLTPIIIDEAFVVHP